jgi:iron-sulfur cluster repair protein YtfE (RIC family)
MTTPPYDGATPEQLASPYVQELLAVHGMFRREMATMLRYADALLNGDQSPSAVETQSRIQSLIRAGSQYTMMLHHHHHLESDTLFPVLEAQGMDRAIVDRLNREHDEISVLIDAFSESVHDLTTAHPDAATTDLQKLSDALIAHLAYEETHVCPMLARLGR